MSTALSHAQTARLDAITERLGRLRIPPHAGLVEQLQRHVRTSHDFVIQGEHVLTIGNLVKEDLEQLARASPSGHPNLRNDALCRVLLFLTGVFGAQAHLPPPKLEAYFALGQDHKLKVYTDTHPGFPPSCFLAVLTNANQLLSIREPGHSPFSNTVPELALTALARLLGDEESLAPVRGFLQGRLEAAKSAHADLLAKTPALGAFLDEMISGLGAL